jgi:2-dehydropantoate 2-reductase
MIILIYGGGAVGLALASCLLKSKDRVDIIARKGTVSALQQDGLVRTGIFGDYSAKPSEFGCYCSLGQLPKKVYDFIIVSTKSFDSHQAAKDLIGHKFLFCEKTKIMLFQNGWGNAEAFTSFFDKKIIYNARIITGFQRLKPNEVTISVHADSIHIGSLFGGDLRGVEQLCRSINEGDIPCRTADDIAKDIWAKMLYNCALNPLGAVLDVPYGKLAEHEYTRLIMDGIIKEVFVVMKKAGYRTHWRTVGDFLKVFYHRLVPDTASHKSSMLQDILAKKPTEIDALNGAVIALAQHFGAAVPYNMVIYNIMKFIEKDKEAKPKTQDTRPQTTG